MLEVADSSAVCSALDSRRGAAVEGSTSPGPAAIVIRPERISLHTRDEQIPSGYNVIGGTVTEIVYLGSFTQVHVDVGASSALLVEVPNHSGPGSVTHQPGSAVNCVCSHDAVRVLHRSAAVLPTDAAEVSADEEDALSAT